MTYSGERTVYFQSSLNIMLSIFILCLLASISIHYYRKPRETVNILAHFASTDGPRLAIRYHYALTGDWPVDAESVLYPQPDKNILTGFNNSQVTIQDGSVQIPIVSGYGRGQQISVRPATPTADPIGPVHWVVGPGDQLDWRTIHGTDLTTIDPNKILKPIR